MPLYLIIKRKKPELLVLSLGTGFRIFFSGILLLFFFGMYVSETGIKDLGILAILFLGATVLSLFYQERWDFDLKEGKITNRTGLLFFYRKRVFLISQISDFGLSVFTKGTLQNPSEEKRRFFQKQYCSLFFRTSGEEKTDLEIQNRRHQQKLEEKGKTLSSFCSKPFRVD